MTTDWTTVPTEPDKWDTDGDLLGDGDEILEGKNPNDPSDGNLDSDNDGLTFAMEYYLGTDVNDSDTDDDLLPDGWEVAHGFDPLDPSDGLLDEDGDGTNNGSDFVNGGTTGVFGGANPWRGGVVERDTDGDGISDQEETENGTDPFDPDDPGPPPPPPPCNP